MAAKNASVPEPLPRSDAVEDLRGVPEALGERAAELEVIPAARVGRHRAVHPLHLLGELVRVD
jgi:hypothetical protein